MTDPVAAGSTRTSPEGAPRPGRHGRRAAALTLARTVGIVAGLVTAYYLVPLDTRTTLGTSFLLLCGLVALLLVFGWEAWLIVHSPHPRLKAVEALAATVALYLVVYSSVYFLIERDAPGSFTEPLTRTDALYFTLTTFTTVGYGDITARSETGRVAVMCQMVCGLLILGVAARLVAAAVQAGLRRQGREPPA
ncbi:ion channel [Streptomyces sp. NPDC004561]